MLFQIIGLVQVGRLHVEKLESGNSDLEIIKGWKPLRILNVLIGFSALVFCIGGVYLISQSAMLLISSIGT